MRPDSIEALGVDTPITRSVYDRLQMEVCTHGA